MCNFSYYTFFKMFNSSLPRITLPVLHKGLSLMEYRESGRHLSCWSIPQCFNVFPFFSSCFTINSLSFPYFNHSKSDARYFEACLDHTHTPHFPAPTYHKHVIYYFINLLVILLPKCHFKFIPLASIHHKTPIVLSCI
jgi:hypothetical protein